MGVGGDRAGTPCDAGHRGAGKSSMKGQGRGFHGLSQGLIPVSDSSEGHPPISRGP